MYRQDGTRRNSGSNCRGVQSFKSLGGGYPGPKLRNVVAHRLERGPELNGYERLSTPRHLLPIDLDATADDLFDDPFFVWCSG